MFPAWIIIVLVLFALMIFLFKSANNIYLLQMVRDNFFYVVMIGIFIFLAISLTTLHAKHNFDFTSYEGLIQAGKVYFGWLGNVFSNMGKITGYALQQEWVTNSTNSTGGG